jgi:WD40 repeat protein
MRVACCLVVALLCCRPLAAAEAGRVYLALDPGGHTGMIWDACFLSGHDEVVTVAADKTIRVWDLPTGQTTRVLRPPVGPGTDGVLIGATVSPNARTLAVTSMGTGKVRYPIYLISLLSGRIRRVLTGHEKNGNMVAFSPDGRRLVSGANDGTARIWDVSTGECLHVLKGHGHACINAVAFSPDGEVVGTACPEDRTARLWSVKTGKPLRVLRHKGKVFGLSFDPRRKEVVTAVGWSLCVWAQAGKFVKEHDLGKDLNYCRHVGPGRVFFTGGRSGILDVDTGKVTDLKTGYTQGGAVSSEGKRAVTVTEVGEVEVWDLTRKERLQTLASRSKALWSAGWANDGSLAFGTTGQRKDAVNPIFPLTRAFPPATLTLTDAPTGDVRRGSGRLGERTLVKTAPLRLEWREGTQVVHRFDLNALAEAGDMAIRAFTFLSQKRAAVADGFGRVYLLDLEAGKVRREWKGHTGTIWAVAPSPDGKYVLSAAADHTLRVWSDQGDEPLLSLLVAGDDWVTWTPQGYYACSPGGENLIGWHQDNGPRLMGTYHPASRFRKSLYRPDVIQRLLAEGSVEKALAAADRARGEKSTLTQASQVLPPVVLITKPDRLKSEVVDPALEVRFLAQPVGKEPIRAVRLLVNGRPYPGSEGLKKFSPPRWGPVREAWTIKLVPGRHTIAVKAETAVSHAVSETVEVTQATRGMQREDTGQRKERLERQRPNLYVLAVGISAYPDPYRLRYAAKDAKVLAKTCQDRCKGLFRKVEVRLLTDKEATRKAILQGLSWARKQATQNDVVILSFAGHGMRDSDGSLFLFPVDGDADDLLATGVPADQVKRTLMGLPGRALLLLDACHAGAVGGDRRRAVGGLTDDLARDLATDDYGVVVLCSSMGREFSIESDSVEHGYFTLALVEGLSGKGGKSTDGAVYLHHLEGHVVERVKKLSDGRQHPVVSKPSTIRSFPLAKP